MRALRIIETIALATLVSCTGRLDANAPPGNTPPDSGAPGPVPDAGIFGEPDAGPDAGVTAPPDAGVPDGGAGFSPLSISAAVGKVKTLLTGLAPTDAEEAAVAADPSALKGLVDQWMQSPSYGGKMQSFFGTSFQQTQVVPADFADQGADADDPRLLANLSESFARTALELNNEGHPFTETMTTRRFMLTPRLMALYAFVDAQLLDDKGNFVDLLAKANPNFKFTLEASQGPIPLAQSLDPASANYMVFYAPQLARPYDPLCPQDPIVYTQSKGFPAIGPALYGALKGQAQTFSVLVGGNMHNCNPPSGPSIYASSDLTQWQMLNIRPPKPGEATTSFYDLISLRGATELVLNIPRVGFFTTPAFLAGWQTNSSNQARVTLNQTMIVALGKAIDPSNTTSPPSLAALDYEHAAPGTACFGCHQSLDPMRQFFRQGYSLHFSPQTASAQMAMPGMFAFHGVSVSGSTIFDLGAQLAGHPLFAKAWAQKLCTYANSAPCDETDPEFQRIVSVFIGSNYSFNALARELFSSPIVTYLRETQSADSSGETFPIARRDHLCTALSVRLGITDVCGLSVTTNVPQGLQVVRTIATVLPSDQYSRGAEGAVLANDPSLVFRTGLENLCVAVAGQVVDNGASSRYKSANPNAAIADFVHTLMGVTSDRDAQRLVILQGHFAAAMSAGESASDALKSTFVLACLSPSVVGVGQ